MKEHSFQGMTEAGFFPGTIIYLSYWYPRREQIMRIAIFFAAAVVACALGAFLVSLLGFLSHTTKSKMLLTLDRSFDLFFFFYHKSKQTIELRKI